MKNKVYIPSIPTRWDEATQTRVPSIDLNPASKFGNLVAMSDGVGTLQDQIKRVKEKTEEINDDDYILCAGDVVLTAVAIAGSNETCGGANLLRWDRRTKSYETVEVQF